MTPPILPDSIHAFARAVAATGRAYLVGGSVRDHLIDPGSHTKDWDIEVFGVPARDLVRHLRKLGSVNAVGRSFGVYKWRPRDAAPDAPEIDVSIPRRDSKVGPGHTGIAVEGDPTMSIEEAARRRDLTINALMWDIVGEQLIDTVGGLADLKAGRLRAVDDATFLEDPLRALRVVQFAARLEFDADPTLLVLCRAAALDELPAERIQGEWGKLLLKSRRPSLGFGVARQAAILKRLFPDVAAHEADDVLDRLAAGPRAALPGAGPRWALMLAGWLHAAPPAAVTRTLDRMWIHTVLGFPVRDRVLAVVGAISHPLTTDADLRRASVAAPLRLLLPVRTAIDGVDRAATVERARALGILDEPPPPLLLGRHLKGLGVPPGPRMGVLLREVYDQQLTGLVTTYEEAAEAARALLTKAERNPD